MWWEWWECARRPQGELFFFLIKKEPTFLREMVDFGHDAPLEAEEREEHNVGNPSLEVVGQGLSGWLVHLFLEAWEPARVPVSCHLAFDLSLSRNARRLAVIALPQFCCPLLQRLDAFPILEGLQLYGVGCDGRTTKCEFA